MHETIYDDTICNTLCSYVTRNAAQAAAMLMVAAVVAAANRNSDLSEALNDYVE